MVTRFRSDSRKIIQVIDNEVNDCPFPLQDPSRDQGPGTPRHFMEAFPRIAMNDQIGGAGLVF